VLTHYNQANLGQAASYSDLLNLLMLLFSYFFVLTLKAW